MAANERKLITKNRRARHKYEVLETFEAGLSLLGTEIKSIRASEVTIGEAHVRLEGGEAFLLNAHIQPYSQATHFNHDPVRARKLLLHQRELEHLRSRVEEKGLTIVPLSIYLSRGRAKLKIGLCRGKRLHDRRETERRRDEERDAAREMARHQRRSH